MTAWDAHGMGRTTSQITIYTPEGAPLEIFGAAAARRCATISTSAGDRASRPAPTSPTAPTGSSWSSRGRGGSTPTASSRCRAPSGPALPRRAQRRARVHPLRPATARSTAPTAVWAAGDAIAFPVKQGGLAAQQADAVAEAIAARAGADVESAAVPARAARRPAHRTRPGVDAQRRRRATTRARRSDARCSGRRRRSPGATCRRTSPRSTARRAVGEAPQPSGQPVELDLDLDRPAAPDGRHDAADEQPTPSHAASWSPARGERPDSLRRPLASLHHPKVPHD